MTFDYIINPETNRKVSIFSTKGRSVLKNYLKLQSAGGSACNTNHKDEASCTDDEACNWRKSITDKNGRIRKAHCVAKRVSSKKPASNCNTSHHDEQSCSSDEACNWRPQITDKIGRTRRAHCVAKRVSSGGPKRAASNCNTQHHDETSCSSDSECLWVQQKTDKNGRTRRAHCRKGYPVRKTPVRQPSACHQQHHDEQSCANDEDCVWVPSRTTKTGKQSKAFCRKSTLPKRTGERKAKAPASHCSSLSEQDCVSDEHCNFVAAKTDKNGRHRRAHCRTSTKGRSRAKHVEEESTGY